MRSHLSSRVQLTEDLLEPLVRGTLAGDRRAWSDLWCALDPFIEKIAGRYRATSRLSASEDERRNVVVRVMERLHADDCHRLQGLHEALLRRDGSFRPWLSTVTMNAAISYTREHPEHLGEHDSNDPGGWVNFEPLPDELDEQLPVSIRAVKMIEAHRIHAYVEHHLEPQQRDALRLWLLGYDHGEIAEAFQLAGAHAADLLVRGALKILRHRFAGGDSPQKKIDQAGLRIGPNLRPVSTWSHEAPARCRRRGAAA